MKVLIETKGDDVVVLKDLGSPRDRGEIAHFVCELENIKFSLLSDFDILEKEDVE